MYEKVAGRRGLGGGDVKLMAMIGAFLGAPSLPLIICFSAALGSLAGFALVAVKGRYQDGQWRFVAIPYGPFLSVGAFIYLLAGENLLRLLGAG